MLVSRQGISHKMEMKIFLPFMISSDVTCPPLLLVVLFLVIVYIGRNDGMIPEMAGIGLCN